MVNLDKTHIDIMLPAGLEFFIYGYYFKDFDFTTPATLDSLENSTTT